MGIHEKKAGIAQRKGCVEKISLLLQRRGYAVFNIGVPLMDKQGAVHEKAEAYGIDVSLIRANLRLTPIQRLQRHGQSLATLKKLRTAMEKKRG